MIFTKQPIRGEHLQKITNERRVLPGGDGDGQAHGVGVGARPGAAGQGQDPHRVRVSPGVRKLEY